MQTTPLAMTSPSVQKRNPIVMLAIGWGAPIGGNILGGSVLAMATGIGLFGPLLWLAGAIVAGHFLKKMVEEAKAVSQDAAINPTLFYIPGVNQILSFLNVHGAVERARQQRGLGAAKPKWMYLVIPWFALASDLNDFAR